MQSFKWYKNVWYKQLSLTNKIMFWLALIAILIALIALFYGGSKFTQTHFGSGDNVAGDKYEGNTFISQDNSDEILEQNKKDAQTALIYQTEISHFFLKFRVCLHWTLPIGDNTDQDINSVFDYNKMNQGIDFNKIDKDILVKIFMDYDFTRPMQNYEDPSGNFQPTGFNNILGILDYFDAQLEKHLNKYGSGTSYDLISRIEYMQRMVQSTKTNIRLDLNSKNKIDQQTAENIADLLYLMNEDLSLMQDQYTSNITGGYPIAVGEVTKSDAEHGSMLFESQFSNY